jgi:methylglyoxal reductase
MRRRELGTTGEEVPVLGVGTWAIGGDMWGPAGERESIEAVRAAVDHGMTLVDTAPVYGGGRSEEIVGKAIRHVRDRVFLATKCGLRREASGIVRDLRPASIRAEIEASLRRLGVSHVDLYQCHWPVTDTPIEEIVGTLEGLRQEGKTRHFGVSNFGRDLLEASARAGGTASLQSEYSLVTRDVEDAELPSCVEMGLGFIAYAPMAGGLLTGKYDVEGPPPSFPSSDARSFFYRFFAEPGWSRTRPLVRAVIEAAAELGVRPGHVAVAWVLGRRGVTSALVGARTAAQAIENARAADLELPAEIADGLSALSPRR